MSRPLRIEYPGALYHVLSRGNERKEIFRGPVDYELFLGILADTVHKFNLVVHAWCLMPNHFHMLLETPGANLCDSMKRLLGLYTVRFNRAHKRSGHLFQGRYKALLVDKDNYFLELSRYIHLNPIKAELAKTPESYRWSSMRYFLRDKAPWFLAKDLTLKSFSSTKEYRSFVLEGLNESLDPFREAIGGLVVGSEDFLEKIQPKISKKSNKDYPGRRALGARSVETVERCIQHKDRNFSIYALWRLSRLTQGQIGARFNISHSAVSHAIKRFETRLAKDRNLQKELSAVEQVVQDSKTDT